MQRRKCISEARGPGKPDSFFTGLALGDTVPPYLYLIFKAKMVKLNMKVIKLAATTGISLIRIP